RICSCRRCCCSCCCWRCCMTAYPCCARCCCCRAWIVISESAPMGSMGVAIGSAPSAAQEERQTCQTHDGQQGDHTDVATDPADLLGQVLVDQRLDEIRALDALAPAPGSHAGPERDALNVDLREERHQDFVVLGDLLAVRCNAVFDRLQELAV